MVATISINPFKTTVAQGQFGITTNGLVQGDVFPDPTTRNALRTTILDEDETLPMWGGVGVYEDIPGLANGPNQTLGPITGRATALTGSKALAGFSTWSYSNVNSPQSPVPLAGSGQQVLQYPLGSRARIIVACDDELVAILQGGPINANVSWDFIAQRLIPYVGTLTISSGTYNNTTGVIVLTMSAPVTFGDGDAVVLSSLTGTGAYASLNGTYIAVATAGSTVTLQAAAGVGASTITGGSLVLGSGASSALPVKVLDLQETGCMVVVYDEDTGFATWNYDGAAAVIQI